MSPIRIPSLALGLLLSLIVLSGCGDKNPQADLSSTSGKHPASWLPAGHATAAKDHLDACTECHGSDFTGGISKIACTQCHLGNALAPHPLFWNYTSTQPTAWGTYAYAFHGVYAKQKGTTSCAAASCHGTGLQGVSGSGPSCTSCHKDVMSTHPVEWAIRLTHSPGGVATVLPDHGTWVNNTESASCRNAVCHGPQGLGVFLSGLACSACHNSSF
jgi:hypothetical protein